MSDHELPAGQAVGPAGEIASTSLLAHSAMFEPRRWTVADTVHSLVGWGLANTTVIEAPDGLVIIDTGECIEEAADHVAELRRTTDAPAAAVVYTHFHYVSGTSRWLDEAKGDLPIWAHHRLPGNIASSMAETGPSWVRRALTQFGVFLPNEGPDAMPNVGLGPFMFNPAHGGRTPGHVTPTDLVSTFPSIDLAGVAAEIYEAPSDADDSIIIFLPEQGVAVNNNVWPTLFNIYPLRGEPYRDPQTLLVGLDLLRELDPEHLVGTHGTPISGRDAVQQALLDHRDVIQFLWDQTVRAINQGTDPDALPHEIELPERFADSPYVQQLYGLARHHVRQIHGGVLGWWGSDGAELVAHHPAEEARRMVVGFGGRDKVLAQSRAALADGDAPWAVRLGSWLVRSDPDDAEGRQAKADALREIGRSTTSANVRAFTLTEARELEGTVDRSFFTKPILTPHDICTQPPETNVRALRVQLDPVAASSVWSRLVIELTSNAEPMALHLRGGVAAFEEVPGGEADLHLRLELDTWAQLVCGLRTATDLLDSGDAELVVGELDELCRILDLFGDSRIRSR